MKKLNFLLKKFTQDYRLNPNNYLNLRGASDINEFPGLPTVALVIDRKNWAYDNIARQIIKHLGAYYNFRPVYFGNPEYLHAARILFALKNCALAHMFWRFMVTNIRSDYELQYIAKSGGDIKKFRKEYIEPVRFSAGVYDHLFLNGEDFALHTPRFTKNCNFYYTSSNILYNVYWDLYKRGKIYKPPLKVITDGVDLTLFYPVNTMRLQAAVSKRPMRIGWAGNNEWEGHSDLKGINTIIKPAVENLKLAGKNVQLIILDRKNAFVPHSKMPDFYNGIDVYVCASETEGTPNTVLEAMACGVPVISTDVGVVSEAFGDLQKEFIVKRSVSALEEKIKTLLDNPEMLIGLSNENLASVKEWDWSKRVLCFKEYFDICLNT